MITLGDDRTVEAVVIGEGSMQVPPQLAQADDDDVIDMRSELLPFFSLSSRSFSRLSMRASRSRSRSFAVTSCCCRSSHTLCNSVSYTRNIDVTQQQNLENRVYVKWKATTLPSQWRLSAVLSWNCFRTSSSSVAPEASAVRSTTT